MANPPPPRAARRRTIAVPAALWPAISIVASFALLVPLLLIANVGIGLGYSTLFSGSFGSSADIGFFLLASVPMILIGVGVAVPYRAGLFNIGGEGQLIVGALAAVALATNLPAALGGPISFLLPLLAAAAAGAVWGAIAGALKAWRDISEIVTTILLSFLGLLLVQYLISGPLQGPGVTYPATAEVPSGFQIAAFGSNGLLPYGFILAVVLTVLVWGVTEFTRVGWRVRLVGLNRRVAARQGISVKREQIFALAIGGALAGLGGACDALGNQLHVGLDFFARLGIRRRRNSASGARQRHRRPAVRIVFRLPAEWLGRFANRVRGLSQPGHGNSRRASYLSSRCYRLPRLQTGRRRAGNS